MGKVTLTGYIVVPPDDLARVLAELPNHIELTRNEPGCIAFEVTQAPSDPYRFDVAEEFQDRQAFERHQQRVRSSFWGEVTTHVERHYEISEAANGN